MRYLVIAALSLLAGCTVRWESTSEPAPTPEPQKPYQPFYVFTDIETGCEYLRLKSSYGITPRMQVDGRQICRKGE